jgi:hydrogenase nickel incorporation protein HypA/HybF
MHELSIVAAVLDQLSELKQQHAGSRFTKVGLRVGEVAGVDVDCLRFGFECSVKETEWESLVLEIEQVARRQRCPRCNIEFTAREFAAEQIGAQDWTASYVPVMPFTVCPECGEAATLTIAGEELQIAYVEVETGEVETSEVKTSGVEEA